DFYECFNNSWDLTSGFHAFCFDLHTDKKGRFYFAFGAPVRGGGRSFERLGRHHGSIIRVSKDGKKMERYATGFRAPNGISVGPHGQVTSGDNEGTFVPRSPINWIKEDGFGGVVDTYRYYKKMKTTPTVTQLRGDKRTVLDASEMPKPLVWLPKSVDNSGGGQAWVTSNKWGPLKNQLLHMSYGKSSLYLVLKEMKGEQIQGGVVKFHFKKSGKGDRLTSSAMRARFNKKDGQLYLVGLRGWQTNAAQMGGFDRIRYTGKNLYKAIAMKTNPQGLTLTFSDALDAELANDPTSYSLKAANIKWTGGYGSKDYLLDGTKQGWTQLKVKYAKLQKDGKSVFLEIENFQPAHQLELSYDLEATDGQEMIDKFWFTIHQL
ncbi:MAG: hypothetical protein HRT88_19295, partial [Lentisphaeraceae bacterium]|nr:hypothetical protein [Lentisphaeraceae bacterium]